VVDRVRRSVVSVIAGRAGGEVSTFGEHARPTREHALGSGVLIAPDGLVLTSRHVIDGADDVRVELEDGRSFAATIVGRDAVLDVALIRLAGAQGLSVAELGSSADTRVGDAVIAIGNPFGLGPSVTVGILSAAARSLDDGPSGEFLQTDAAVNPGDSGGPLIDGEGRVIGINTAVLEHGQGISFAIPIDEVRAVLRELTATGRVARGRAGVTFQVVDGPLSRALRLPSPSGALVSEVDADGPAQRAGVRPGDLITSMEGQAILRAGDLSHALTRRKPGEVVRFGILRGGCSRVMAVLLGRQPNRDGDAEGVEDAEAHHAHVPARSKGISGLRLVDADQSGGGARIDALDPESTAADGLRQGDVVVEVDHTPVRCAADANRRLALTPRPGTALFRVRRDGLVLYVGVDLA
jgi:serine protease Do